jgi:tetrahedral aminopeptidase
LVGQSVFILTNSDSNICNGVISFKELQEDLLIERVPQMSDLYVDTGLDKNQLTKLGVTPGAYLIASHKFKTLGSPKIISGKALDDRIGCFVLINLIKKMKKVEPDTFFVFTVQEEIGLHGAHTAVYGIDPDWAIAVDTTNSEDGSDQPNIYIGGGPCITIMDTEMVSNRCLNNWLFDICRKNKIPYQPKVEDVGTTDAAKIRLSKGGIPSTVLNAPIRNIHSTISIAHMDDVNNMIKILEHLLKNPPKICLV